MHADVTQVATVELTRVGGVNVNAPVACRRELVANVFRPPTPTRLNSSRRRRRCVLDNGRHPRFDFRSFCVRMYRIASTILASTE